MSLPVPVKAATYSWAAEVEAVEAASNQPAVHVVQTVKKPMVKASRQSSGMCFYHTKFGNKAERCEGKGCYLSPPSTTTKLSGN